MWSPTCAPQPRPGSSEASRSRLSASAVSFEGNRGTVAWASTTNHGMRGGGSCARRERAPETNAHSSRSTTRNALRRMRTSGIVRSTMLDRASAAAVLMLPVLIASALAQPRPRARDLGLAPGVHPPGPLNAITDVGGVRVGHTTIVEGDRVRTGVTAILPHVGNPFGKLAGSTQVNELGTIETPIVLTNTLGVGTAVEAVVRYTIGQPGNEQVRSVNALVGETNDGGLNDIRGLHVTRDHVLEAIRGAKEGAVAEGAVGAGTGTICYGWKGGIGTASRRLASRAAERRPEYTVGVLAQTNFG